MGKIRIFIPSSANANATLLCFKDGELIIIVPFIQELLPITVVLFFFFMKKV